MALAVTVPWLQTFSQAVTSDKRKDDTAKQGTSLCFLFSLSKLINF